MAKAVEYTLKITESQALTLHAALRGLLAREDGSPNSQRNMDRILIRLSKTMGWRYRPAFGGPVIEAKAR